MMKPRKRMAKGGSIKKMKGDGRTTNGMTVAKAKEFFEKIIKKGNTIVNKPKKKGRPKKKRV